MSTDLEERTLGLLRSQSSWTSVALAEALGVSLRTIRRVLARLVQTGVPLETEPGRGGGIRLVGSFGLSRLRLDHSEVLNLLLALAIAESLNVPLLLNNLRGLRQKLGIVLPPEQRNVVAALRRRILIGQPASAEVLKAFNLRTDNTTKAIQNAFLSLLPLELRYVSGKGVTSERSVEPHYLLLNYPVWYLLAFDLDKQAARCFRLDRIKQVAVGEKRFRLRSATELMNDIAAYFGEV